MNMTEELLKRLDVLAAKLGVTAQYLWSVLVKQAHIEATACFVYAALWLLVTITFISFGCYFRRVANKGRDRDGERYRHYDSEGWEVASVFAFVLSFLPIWGVIYWLTDGILYRMNPEFYALKYLLEALK